jgi:hypothetical protein
MTRKTRVLLLIAVLAVLLAVPGWLLAGRRLWKTPAPAGTSAFISARQTAGSARPAVPEGNSADQGGCCNASAPS